ncbi:MAG: hypothetical protein E7Z73_05885 [Methanobrevibacter millerae]|uniref:Uncharacterized protein n=1 Tax=Methanobrevibacter millerae TaxID=230361 RepID=A0A8T3VFL7_9EURY|nr:hypothetical protein [Methanobrevibacter millerae]MBE6505255.1 hypothetical protein [Methanobrevibacter millerae]
MQNQDLNNKLTDNYLKQVQDYLKDLTTKGFVIFVNYDGNQSIYRYSVKVKDFIPANTNLIELVDSIKRNVPNNFNVPVDTNKYMNMIIETFPAVSLDDIEEFQAYNKAIANIKDEKLLKQELKSLKQEFKGKYREINSNSDSVFEETQLLINNQIIVYEIIGLFRKMEYYQFNSKENKFNKLTAEEIQKIINETFNNTLNIRLVERRMKNEFADYGVKSKLPVAWNDNQEYIKNIKNYKNCKLNKIAETYI